MADYYSILSKTISGLKNNDTQMREAVFQRARATIEKQLRNMDPVPSEDTIAAQLSSLQEAAVKIEAEYTLPPEPETVDILPSSDEVAASQTEAAVPSVEEETVETPVEQAQEPQAAASTPVESTPENEPQSEPQSDASFVIAPAEPTPVAPREESVVEAPQEPISAAPVEKPDQSSVEPARSGSDSDAFVIAPAEPVSATPVEEPIVDAPTEPIVETEVVGAVEAASVVESEVVETVEEPVLEEPTDPIYDQAVEAPQEIVDEVISEPFVDPVMSASATSAVGEVTETIHEDISSIDTPDVGNEVELSTSPDFETLEPQTVDLAPPPSISLEQEVAQSVEPQVDDSVDVQSVQSPTSDAIDAVAAAVEEDDTDRSGHVSVLDSEAAEPKKSSKIGCFLFILVLLLALGGGGYGAWLNKDTLMEKANGILANLTNPTDEPQDDGQEEGQETVTKESVRIGENGEDASADPVEETQEQSGETELAVDLAPEVSADPEPETTQEQEQAEETVTPEAPTEPEEPVIETAEEGENKPEETQPDPNSLGEVAYLYEAGPAGTGAVRVNATVVWELKKYEQPEAGRADTYIYGKMEVPERDVSMDIQIDRNLDEGLSASHLIDIKFDLPEGFKGQGIESVARFVMKSTEEAEGEPLIAVPVKVEDGHFLIALGNVPNAVKFNTQLLMSGAWVDIPINYESGKRALLVIEKGGTGDQIFKEAFAAWSK